MTKVRFRKFKDNGEIIAIFPDLNYPKYVSKKGFCVSYLHMGQHGECDYNFVMSVTNPTIPEEYAILLAELKDIGYDDLVIIS